MLSTFHSAKYEELRNNMVGVFSYVISMASCKTAVTSLLTQVAAVLDQSIDMYRCLWFLQYIAADDILQKFEQTLNN